MSNLEDSYEAEMEPIILIPELDDTQKTDEEVSLNSEKNQRTCLQSVHQVLFGNIMKK